jgi:hypothetical protein
VSRRVLIVVTHLLDAGRLTRAGHETTLVSGGRPAPLVSTEGVRFL